MSGIVENQMGQNPCQNMQDAFLHEVLPLNKGERA